jgi:hypothetical protein
MAFSTASFEAFNLILFFRYCVMHITTGVIRIKVNILV